jgi:hypothetical protein
MSSNLTHPMRKSLLSVTALVLSAQLLSAQTTIGASLTGGTGPFTRDPAGFQTFGQSFVAPTLSRLNSFSLSFSNFFNGGALRFDAYLFAFDATNRRLTGNALWSSLNIAGSSNDFDFDTRTFTLGVNLTPSSTFMFLMTTSNQGSSVPLDASNLIGTNDTNEYALGGFWIASNGANFSALSSNGAFSSVNGISDAAFAASFGAVPEPTTVVLTALGLCLLGGLSARRRARTM